MINSSAFVIFPLLLTAFLSITMTPSTVSYAAPLFDDNCNLTDTWDILDIDGDGACEITTDISTPPGYGPEVLHVTGSRVLGLAKGVRLAEGTVVLLYRELEPAVKDADGIIAIHADYRDNVSEEHNTKLVRPHTWLEMDNDHGLHFVVYESAENEFIPAEAPGVGLVTDAWNATNWIWQKVQFGDGVIKARFWPANEPEPDTWHLETARPKDKGLRLGFRINSGDVHIAQVYADAQDIPISPPAAWLFTEQQEVTQTKQLDFTLYTNLKTGDNYDMTLTLTGPSGEMPTGTLKTELSAGASSLPILLSTTSDKASLQLTSELEPGAYTLQAKSPGHTELGASCSFVVLPIADITHTFNEIRQSIDTLCEILNSITEPTEHAARLGVVHDSALAHWEYAQSLLEAGSIDDAQRAMRFAVEAMTELKGYKGAWLKKLVPNIEIPTLPVLPSREKHVTDPTEIRDLYSPDYLLRFGIPQCSAASFVMGNEYTIRIPWSLEGTAPDRDFSFEVTLESSLGHRVVAQSTTPPKTPVREWQPGNTYWQEINFRIKNEFDEIRPAQPVVSDEEHLLLIRVADKATGAMPVLDNTPTPRGGPANLQYLAGTYYVSSTPVEIHGEFSTNATVNRECTEAFTLNAIREAKIQAIAVFRAVNETGLEICTKAVPISLASNSQQAVNFQWTPSVAGKATLSLEILDDHNLLTQAKKELTILPPNDLTITATKENHVYSDGNLFYTQVHVRNPVGTEIGAQVFANNRMVGQEYSSKEDMIVNAEPWFGYYDIVADFGDFRYAQRIIATVSEVSYGRLLVNGEPFIVKGVNVHGMDSRSPEKTRTMMRVMRDLGFNTWRGDYPARWQIDMAYEMNTAYSPLAPFSCASTDEIVNRQDGPPLATARELTRLFIELYQDSAGTLLWNSCNEIGNETKDFLLSVYPVYKHLDPYNRPVHYANLYGQDRWEGQDCMGINYYFGEGQTPEGRQPIIAKSIAIAKEHNLPVFYTEFNGYLGAIHSTGVLAMEHLFDWGIEQGMSGGFYYMKQNSSSHPGIFDNDFNTYSLLNASIRDAFEDAKVIFGDTKKNIVTIEIINKRDFTLRQLALNANINGINVEAHQLSDIKPKGSLRVPLPLPNIAKDSTPVIEGNLQFVTHFGFRCTVPFRVIGL